MPLSRRARRAIPALLATLLATILTAAAAVVGSAALLSQPVGAPAVLAQPPAPRAGTHTAAPTSPDAVDGHVVAVSSTPTGAGWVSASSSGGVANFGDAPWWGSAAGIPLHAPIVGIAETPTAGGYWLVASDGGIFTYGAAAFHGSTGAIRLNQPIVGMASTPSGLGYWLVASDGGIFSFGDAAFYGSTGAIHLVRPIVAMATTPSGHGYWLVASDGGIFAFGDALFFGSSAGTLGGDSARAMVTTLSGDGYWIVTTGGAALAFGDAPPVGGSSVGGPVAGAASVPGPGVRVIGVNDTTAVYTAGGAVSAPQNSSSFSWMMTNTDGSAVRWNPCAPIHYVTNLAEAPAGAAALVAQAVGDVSAATGIPFVYDGTTNAIPVSSSATQPNPDGTWKPVIVAWARPSQTDLLPGGGVIGVGGPAWSQDGGGPKVYVSGNVLIDPDNTANLLPSFGAGSSLGELLLHEFGHLLGLGHTPDSSQVMFPTLLPLPAAAYGPGDLAGLRQLGVASGCLTTPPA